MNTKLTGKKIVENFQKNKTKLPKNGSKMVQNGHFSLPITNISLHYLPRLYIVVVFFPKNAIMGTLCDSSEWYREDNSDS